MLEDNLRLCATQACCIRQRFLFFPGLDSRLCTLRPGKYARHRGMSKEQLLIGALADVQEERLKEPFRQDREE